MQGSGAVVSTNALGGFVLTAQHVCESMDESDELLSMITLLVLGGKKKNKTVKLDRKIKVISHRGQTAIADVLVEDEGLDACLLFAENLQEKPLKRYYGKLTIGQRYYNIASPVDIADPGMVPLLEGRYIGNRTKLIAAFTIPAAGGSSGSAIVDSSGRLVGLLHSTTRGFNHVSYASDISLLNKFIDDNMTIYHDKWYQNMLKLTRPKTN